MRPRLWVVCLAVRLILTGLLTLTNLRFEGQTLASGCLAVAAGVLALPDR